MVPDVKNNGKIRVCTDFRNLNLASPKDEFSMPVADFLVDLSVQKKMYQRRHSDILNRWRYIIEKSCYLVSRIQKQYISKQ